MRLFYLMKWQAQFLQLLFHPTSACAKLVKFTWCSTWNAPVIYLLTFKGQIFVFRSLYKLIDLKMKIGKYSTREVQLDFLSATKRSIDKTSHTYVPHHPTRPHHHRSGPSPTDCHYEKEDREFSSANTVSFVLENLLVLTNQLNP